MITRLYDQMTQLDRIEFATRKVGIDYDCDMIPTAQNLLVLSLLGCSLLIVLKKFEEAIRLLVIGFVSYPILILLGCVLNGIKTHKLAENILNKYKLKEEKQ